MATSGADDILALGGVQALAAMTYGIEGLPEADIIVGAGNAYVAEAKRQLFGQVGIDLLAGPTEVAIIADAGADPELVALDLLGQAEHGPTSPAVLITTSRTLGEAVLEQVERQSVDVPDRRGGRAPRGRRTARSRSSPTTRRRSSCPTASPASTSRSRSSRASSSGTARGLRNYGSLFLGAEATVAYGDKAVGTNHVLPTLRAARYTGGLWVGKFLKTCTYQRLTEEGTRRVAPAVAAIADGGAHGGARAHGHAPSRAHRPAGAMTATRQGRGPSAAAAAASPGRAVLVAGASRGIGAAISVAFAADGAGRVVLVGRTAADLDRVAGDVRAHGAQAEVAIADLTDAGSGARGGGSRRSARRARRQRRRQPARALPRRARGDLRPPVRAQCPRRVLPRAGRRAGAAVRRLHRRSSPRRWGTSAPSTGPCTARPSTRSRAS